MPNWLQSQRKRIAEHPRRVADGDDEFDTDDRMMGVKDENATKIQDNKRTSRHLKVDEEQKSLIIC